MTTNTAPYCAINGTDFSSIVYSSGVEPSGGELPVEEITYPGRNYADIRVKGRSAKKYKVRARSTDRDQIEAFLGAVNAAPQNSKFYPYEASRFALITAAHAGLKAPQPWGSGYNFYEAEAEITCREPWLLGPDKGLTYTEYPGMAWTSATLQNNGHAVAPIRYMRASGQYANSTYINNLRVMIYSGSTVETSRRIFLCDQMMRRDLFEFGWTVPSGALHSYTANMAGTLAMLTYDVQGNVSGGDLTDGILWLDNSDYIMMPFYGPLPVSGEPDAVCISAYVTTSGIADVMVAMNSDLSDMTAVDHTWTVGWNTIYIPGLAGVPYVAIGIKAASRGSIRMSYLRGAVKRYVAPSKIPAAEIGESYKLRMECDPGGSTVLMYGEALVNDRYYY